MHRTRRWCCALLGLVAVGLGATAGAAYRDEAVKAAFLYRFTGYVDWPSPAMRSGRFTVAVLGSRSVAAELDRLFSKHTVKNLPARVRTIESPDQALDTHILYVGSEYSGSLQEVSALVGTRPILLVSDHATGLEDGSAVNFLLIDRRVRFEVSLTATQRAGLKVSSQLLSVAARVRGAVLPRLDDACRNATGDDEPDARCGLRMVSVP
jgi:hypothetical protein